MQANGSGFGHHGGGGRVSVETGADSGTVVVQALAGGAAAQAGTVQRVTPSPLTTADLQSAADAVCHLGEDGVLNCFGDDSLGLVSEAPAGMYRRLAMGSYAACVLHAEGYAHCWGDSGAGSSGILDEPIVELVDVGVGLNAACGVRESDGRVLCWGDPAAAVATGVPTSTGFTAVWLTNDAACARRADGRLSCWGDVGDPDVLDAPALPVSMVDAGQQFLCAVMTDGSLSCWGEPTSGELDAVAGTNFVSVSAGAAHACAIEASGAGVCWGDDTFGQSSVPAGLLLDGIAVGDLHSCGLLVDGNLSCWGDPASSVVQGVP